MTPSKLHAFLTESNRIEGEGPPSEAQVRAASSFLGLVDPEVSDLCYLVGTINPDAKLRDQHGMNVLVGPYLPPYGGSHIRRRLESMMLRLDGSDPYLFHVEYERLHPFSDGNGRSGRLLWLWQMEHRAPGGLQRLGFLHAWYYQSLQGTVPSADPRGNQ